MQASIKQLKNKQKTEIIYPITSTKAVYDENSNRLDSILEILTNSTVKVKDIVNDLETTSSEVPLSAEQGVILKDLIDKSKYELPTATESVLGGVRVGNNITNDEGVLSISSKNVEEALGYKPIESHSTINDILQRYTYKQGTKIQANMLVYYSGMTYLDYTNFTEGTTITSWGRVAMYAADWFEIYYADYFGNSQIKHCYCKPENVIYCIPDSDIAMLVNMVSVGANANISSRPNMSYQYLKNTSISFSIKDNQCMLITTYTLGPGALEAWIVKKHSSESNAVLKKISITSGTSYATLAVSSTTVTLTQPTGNEMLINILYF